MNAVRLATLAFVAGAVLCACDPAPQPSAAPAATPSAPASTAPGPRASTLPTPAQLEAYRAEGPEPTLRKLAATDYWLNYKLMQSTGIEQDLGGEAQAVAVLKKLGEAYERQARGFTAGAPRMMRTAFTGEGMSAGFLGIGAGSFVGFVGGGGISSMVTDMSDADLAALSAKGGLNEKSPHGDGGYEFKVAEDGSLAQSAEFDVKEKNVEGRVMMKSKMTACPDADGRVTVEIEMDSAMSLTDKPGSGGSVHTQFEYERYVDDDAKLIDTADGAASNLRVQMGGRENSATQSVDITMGYERGGAEIFENHGEQGYSIFRPEEVKRTQELLRATQFLETMMAEMMLRGIGSKKGSPWESGHCINLEVTSAPANRSGLKPSTAFDIEAKPRVKADGKPAGGTVTATLTGGSALNPAGAKVKADAKFGYTGPAEKEQEASIDFESRSKRGVGRATLAFDTKVAKAYWMKGGAKELQFAGQVCDLESQFFLHDTDNEHEVWLRFEPASREGGRYSYSGTMTGYDDKGKKYTFRVHGHGDYRVKYADDVAVSITAQGPGTVETPFGPQSGVGMETYRLEPLGAGKCVGAQM